MQKSIKRGMGFGITSGIITTLGLMMGLYSGTNSKFVVLGGILIIAIADAFSDSLGIHISEESVYKGKYSNVWESTFSTLFFKLFTALIFILPVLLFDLKFAILVNLFLGFVMLCVFSYFIGKQKKNQNPWHVVIEHLFIAVLVLILTYSIGEFIRLNLNLSSLPLF